VETAREEVARMWEGTVEAVYIAVEASAPMQAVETVRAIPGQGLAGDRYSAGRGSWSRTAGPQREVTLVESEAIEALRREADIALELGDSRRNIVTRGVPLNHLVGREFLIGDVRLRGVKLCEPCAHLERLTAAGVRPALVHRGGLNAAIVSEGEVRVGDAVRQAE